MHLLSLLSFGNVILFILLCIYIIKLNPGKSKLNEYALFVCLSLGMWNLFYVFFYATTDKDMAWIFYKLATIGMYSFPVFVLKFFIVLTKREKILNAGFIKIILHLPQLAFIIYTLFSRRTPLADDLVLSKIGLGWTYVNHVGKISFWAAFSYLMIYFGFSFYMLFSWGKESPYQIAKKQARLFLMGNSLLLVIGVITDFILPLFKSNIPPIANIFTLIFIVFFSYIIRELNVFDINHIVSSEMIMDTLLEPILILDNASIIVRANPATEAIFGFPMDFLEGKKLREVLADNSEILERNNGETIIKNTPKGEIYVMFSKNKVWNQWNESLGTVIHFKDITEIKEEENKLRIINKKYAMAANKLEQIANYDGLTGLPNRRMFLRELSKASKNSKNDFGLIFMDLNGFKEVNDQWGHGMGDQVLIEIASRLKSLVKTNDFVARLGGDEFIMLVKFDKKEEIYETSQKIQVSISKPIHLEELECQISVATGISIYSENISNIEDMIRSADLAMYEHKRHKKIGRNPKES